MGLAPQDQVLESARGRGHGAEALAELDHGGTLVLEPERDPGGVPGAPARSPSYAISLVSQEAEILCRVSIAQSGCQLALEQIKETVLVRSDLQQDYVIVASLDVTIDRLQMAVG